jgi:hypothetical protein
MTQALPFSDLKPVLQALDALDSPARDELVRRRRTDAAVNAEISAWEQHLTPLALKAPPAAPSAALWDRIEAVIAATVSPPDDPAWIRSAPGTSMKLLLCDDAGRPKSFMLRLDTGAVLPARTPDRDEDLLVLAGELITETGRIEAGGSIMVRAGCLCSAMHSPGGAMLYVSAGHA